jgi:transposase
MRPIVGMEPTRHSWLHMSCWLAERKFEVVLVNPHLVKKNKENRDNTLSNSDKKDDLVIADMVKNGYYSFTRNTPEAFELRVLVSNRAKNSHWVDIVFPELRYVFKNITYICLGHVTPLPYSRQS